MKNIKGEVISEDEEGIYGLRNKSGRGEVIWIPSPLGLAAWHHENDNLVSFLKHELRDQVENMVIGYETSEEGILLKLMRSGDQYILILINPGQNSSTVEFNNDLLKIKSILFNNRNIEPDPGILYRVALQP